MARPVTLFTGQWADLPLEDLAPRASAMGFDGLELAMKDRAFGAHKVLGLMTNTVEEHGRPQLWTTFGGGGQDNTRKLLRLEQCLV